jgi:ribonucleoside-triphosphate reductase
MEIASKILSDITVYMKYARFLPEKYRRETYEELVTRNMQMHIKKFPGLKSEIEGAYQYVYNKKVLPSMRSMQFGGKPIEVAPNRVFNCAYLPIDDIRAFGETMFLLLGGTGVGYSVQAHHIEKLPEIGLTLLKLWSCLTSVELQSYVSIFRIFGPRAVD